MLFALNTMKCVYIKPNKRVRLNCSLSYLTDLANEILDHETGRILNYKQLWKDPRHNYDWDRSVANGRLAQGVGGRVKGTETIFFILKHKVPIEQLKDVTYGRFVCKV